MPVRAVPDTDTHYSLILFDADGGEITEDDGTLLSDRVRKRIEDPAEGITDVFLCSHGWKGDVPAAIEQYDRWVAAMVKAPDRAKAEVRRPGFRPLVVGVHWPSLPFGDESVPETEGGLLDVADDTRLAAAVEEFAKSIADTPTARAAIRTILRAAQLDDGQRETLPAPVRTAYEQLAIEAALPDGRGTVTGPPGTDHGGFDADDIYREARKSAAAEGGEEGGAGAGAPGLLSGGLFGALKGLLVAPLQQLSFWKMKDRARAIGEGGAHDLLVKLQQAAPADTRFHLMGHSFGCIVMSATVAGAPAGDPLPRPVDSLFLVQGALSLWSYAADIPFASGKPGYFRRIVRDGLVRGPIVTTQSRYDTAVGRLYPAAARVKSQFLLGDEYPKYGAVGTFGLQGLGDTGEQLLLRPVDSDYAFAPQRIYNIEASSAISEGGGFSGAHSDIAHPEVAHAFWAAVLGAGN